MNTIDEQVKAMISLNKLYKKLEIDKNLQIISVKTFITIRPKKHSIFY